MRAVILLLISISMLALAEASISIDPNPLSVELEVGQEKTFNVTIQNNHPFAIQDFSFTNITGFTFPSINLDSNESKEINITVLRTSPVQQLINSLVKFNYLVEIPSEPQTHKINITATGYDPQFIVIHEQDTIAWKNVDDITHTVTSSIFDLTLTPNQTIERIFTEPGTITYQDLTLWFGGTIEVLNRTTAQAVHNPIYDYNWQVDLTVTAEPTDLQIENMDESNYTIGAVSSTEGLLKIKNVGGEIAQTVTLSDDKDWIVFEENNFNLDVGEQKFIDYTIAPVILSTNETNKTYEIEVKAKGLNTEESSYTINIFVPYSDVADSLDTDEGFLLWFERYCERNPTFIICNNSISTGGNGSIIYSDPEVQFNFTTQHILELLRRQRQNEDSQQRLDNQLTQLSTELGLTMPELKRLLNESMTQQDINEEKIRNDSITRWIVGFFVLLFMLVGYGAYRYRRYDEKKKQTEGYE